MCNFANNPIHTQIVSLRTNAPAKPLGVRADECSQHANYAKAKRFFEIGKEN